MDELLKKIMQELSLGAPFESRATFYAAIGEVAAEHFKISDDVVRIDGNSCECCARYGYKAGVNTDKEPS
jgi:hypothetical protein